MSLTVNRCPHPTRRVGNGPAGHETPRRGYFSAGLPALWTMSRRRRGAGVAFVTPCRPSVPHDC